MRTLFVAGMTSLLLQSSAIAFERKDSAFFCTQEAAGGVKFDARMKRWVGGAFAPDDGFVLKLKHMRTWIDTEIIKQTMSSFKVTIVPKGKNEGQECGSFGAQFDEDVKVGEFGSMICQSLGSYYWFNLENNRFLQAYMLGYTNGVDTATADTPVMAAGTCTKITE